MLGREFNSESELFVTGDTSKDNHSQESRLFIYLYGSVSGYGSDTLSNLCGSLRSSVG